MLKAKAAPSVDIVTTLLTGGSILALMFLPEKGAVCCCVKTCDVGVRVRVGVLVLLLICYVTLALANLCLSCCTCRTALIII